MKNIILIIAITAMGLPVFIDAQEQAPNAGFENWMTLTNGAENPMGWGSSNFAVAFGAPQTIFKTTDAISGEYALLVTTPTDAGTIYTGQAELNEGAFDDGGLPYTDRPLTMEAAIKGTIYSGDTAFVRARLTRWDADANFTELIAEAYIGLTETDTVYSSQINSFEYFSDAVPDTLFLVAGFGDHDDVTVNADNEFFVDNIVFTGLSTATDESTRLKGVRIFPNPSNGKINIKIDFENKTDLSIIVFNSMGQVVKQFSEEHVLGLEKTFDMSDCPAGVCFFKLKSNGKSITEKVFLFR